MSLSRALVRNFSSSFSLKATAVDLLSTELNSRQTTYTELSRLSSSLEMTPTRKLQVLSDVHLEFHSNQCRTFEKHGHDIALLGDIGKPFDDSYQSFLTSMSQQYDNIFLLLGNHEFYNVGSISVEQVIDKARSVCAQLPNVHLLDREAFDITQSTRILGCTLWSAIDRGAAMGLNDFRMISTSTGKLAPSEYFEWHTRDVAWLERELAQCVTDGKNAVILTHHGPCEAMAGRFLGTYLNSAFVTNLERLFKPPVIAFASGHVHSNCDVYINGIRSVSNALGYAGEDTGFRQDVVIDIP